MQAAACAMAGNGGSIVNLSSRSGSQPCPPTAHYGAAKAGVDSLTATAAVEWVFPVSTYGPDLRL